MGHFHWEYFVICFFQSWCSPFFSIIVYINTNLWQFSSPKWNSWPWQKQREGEGHCVQCVVCPGMSQRCWYHDCVWDGHINHLETTKYFAQIATFRWCVHIQRCWFRFIWQRHYMGNVAWPMVLHEENYNENHPIQQTLNRWTAALRRHQAGLSIGQRTYLK